jgi:hypothetical protein
MFGRLERASWPTADIDLLASKVMAEEEEDPTPETEVDEEENEAIDIGITYAGQFIDHDLTLDDRPNDLTTPVNPYNLKNQRTPAFDLDSLYGKGPRGSPQLYESDGVHLKLGSLLTGSPDPRAADVPRGGNGQALLGDHRNDENRIIGQLHTIFIRFHNQIADRIAAEHPRWSKTRVFEEAQRQTRLHYQWAVLTDFLPTIVGRETMRAVLPDMRNPAPNLAFYNPCSDAMPVEFAVAAYRFGHSMVRPLYRINPVVPRLPVFSTAGPTTNLGGFSPAPSNFGIDWGFFFQMDAVRVLPRPQTTYKLDNSLVFPLGLLPLPETGTGPASLAKRNLLRSVQVGLPSGQDVARAMGVRPLRDDQILVGKATGDPADTVILSSLAPSFAGKAPLWTYVLAEATAKAFNIRDGEIVEPQRAPMRLGPVGGRIVAETFVGLMAADRSSILYETSFRPYRAYMRNGEFGFREIILAVTSAPASTLSEPDTIVPNATETPTPASGTPSPAATSRTATTSTSANSSVTPGASGPTRTPTATAVPTTRRPSTGAAGTNAADSQSPSRR